MRRCKFKGCITKLAHLNFNQYCLAHLSQGLEAERKKREMQEYLRQKKARKAKHDEKYSCICGSLIAKVFPPRRSIYTCVDCP